MTRALTARLLPLVLALVTAGPAAAQDAPSDPLQNATVRFGPIGLNPSIVIRDIGKDNNVFNEPVNAKEDFTATITPKLDVLVHPSHILLTYSTTSDYVYYQTYTSERGVNFGSSLRADFEFGPVKPYVAVGGVNSRDRINREIDVRARHRDRNYGGGVQVRIFEGLFAAANVRQTRTAFDDDAPEFRGVKLSETLNGTTDAVDVGGGVDVTPLTTISVTYTRQRDRFELSPERDSESWRIAPTVTFSPLAILSGSASVGYRKFTPDSPVVPGYSGLVSNLTLATTVLERNRIETTFSRDVQYSAEDVETLYVETGVQASWTWQITGPFDVRLSGGRSRLNYRSAGLTSATDDDKVTNYGVSLGYHVRERLRVGLNADWHDRASERGFDRTYQNRRIYANLTWGK
jgi:hypothetical protein